MKTASSPPLLGFARRQGLETVAERLGSLADGLALELEALERELEACLAGPRPSSTGPTGRALAAARHLLDAGGKRARPFLCCLAARVPAPHAPASATAQLAQAVELVHGATLLHDDVIDLGERRRGGPTARLIFGNAASVLGGDLLLVEALRRIEAAGVPGCLERMLEVLEAMIAAESLQLEQRGRCELSRAEYFEIVGGKTAALFEWALEAGARAGGAAPAELAPLRAFGREVGVAFQLADDLLDVAGDPQRAGKAVLQDARQGTVTYPLIAALEARPELGARVAAAAAGAPDDQLGADVLAAVAASGAREEARAAVRAHTRRAIAGLEGLPESPAARALVCVAEELAERSS